MKSYHFLYIFFLDVHKHLQSHAVLCICVYNPWVVQKKLIYIKVSLDCSLMLVSPTMNYFRLFLDLNFKNYLLLVF